MVPHFALDEGLTVWDAELCAPLNESLLSLLEESLLQHGNPLVSDTLLLEILGRVDYQIFEVPCMFVHFGSDS